MMEKSFYDFAPDAQVLLALEPEEVRGIVLEYLNTLPESSANLNRHNFGLAATFSKYPQEYRERVSRAVMEGWSWLERQGLIAPRPSGGGMGGDWISVTRKGRGIKSRKDIEAYQHANLLPRQLLHREVANAALPPFIRGNYDSAVFEAFKQVEIAVRTKGKYAATDYGVALMRKAFDPNTGPLRNPDPAVPFGEREAEAHLFAGAIGCVKNPQSHRNVQITDPGEAIDLLFVANRLMRIVEAR